MKFEDIRKGIGDIAFEALRADENNYFEAVLTKDNLAELTACLLKLFGPPAWPSKDPVPLQAQDIISDFGGIRNGQTLYLNSDGQAIFFAMLWPWQDMEHTTVKISETRSRDK